MVGSRSDSSGSSEPGVEAADCDEVLLAASDGESCSVGGDVAVEVHLIVVDRLFVDIEH